MADLNKEDEKKESSDDEEVEDAVSNELDDILADARKFLVIC